MQLKPQFIVLKYVSTDRGQSTTIELKMNKRSTEETQSQASDEGDTLCTNTIMPGLNHLTAHEHNTMVENYSD